MKLTLTTYDSIVCATLGYLVQANAISFIESLTEKVNEFSRATGIPANKVKWTEVQKSDWCKFNVVLWVDVPNDWQPTADTLILGEKVSDWYSNLERSFSDYISGSGIYTNTDKYPATNPHKLYHSK